MPITRIGTYSQIQGTSFKLPCKVATTAAITLSGTQTIDGVAVVAGDRVLVKNQGTGADNGIYIVAAGAWSRAVDMSIDEDVFDGLLVFINLGSTNANTTFFLDTANPITLGVTSLTFTLTGTSGTSGTSGTTGTSGTRGTSGTSGTTGTSGTSGVSGVTGSGTTNQITYWTSSSAIGALTTVTYPSLTELSYVKGVTSAIQTQISSKQAQLNGTGFVKATGTTISYDNSTYLTTAVTSIAGTANQIAVSAATGAVTVSLTSAVTISGAMTASGFFESSDERLKDIIKRDGDVAYFKWKNSDGDDKTHIGYIAQEVQQTHPDQVGESNEYLTVNYIEMLVEKVRTLEKELANLKSKL
jgi:hypothetical protein